MLQKDKRYLALISLVNCGVILLSFIWLGPYSARTDTIVYLNQINIIRGDLALESLDSLSNEVYHYKIYKPFYGMVGYWPLGSLDAKVVIQILNILFLFGLTISSYYLFKYLGFEEKLAFYGTVWIGASYPVFKYGIALVTDISGWFFAVLSVLIFLHAIKTNKTLFLSLASLVGFLGSISKETGVLGLLFCGLYLVFHFKEYGLKNLTKKLFYLCAPFFLLQVVLMVVMTKINALPLLDWIKFNYDLFFEDFYKLRYFITSEFYAFGLVWVFAIVGFFQYIKEKFWLDKERMIVLLSSVLATSVVLLWPVFYYRIIFIQLLFVIPLALHGARILLNKSRTTRGRILVESSMWLPVVFSAILFLVIKKY